MTGYDRKPVSARLPEPLIEQIDEEIVDNPDYDAGNRGSAIGDLLRSALDNDIEPQTGPETFVPADETLRCIYQHALDTALAIGDHSLDEDELGEVAKRLNNDSEAPVSPGKTGLRRYLEALEEKGYIRERITQSMRDIHITWLLKPRTATVEDWRHTRENEEARERRREKIRRQRRKNANNPTQKESIRKYQRADLNVAFDLACWATYRVVWSGTAAESNHDETSTDDSISTDDVGKRLDELADAKSVRADGGQIHD